MSKTSTIVIKSDAELQVLREAGKILAAIIADIKSSVKIGVRTQDIDQQVEALIARYGVKPAFKGYRGFPASTCISVNEEVVHGIPGNRVLLEGDIVSLDIGIRHKGYYSDTAITIPLGKVKPEIQSLLDTTRESLYRGIEQAQVNNHLSDISHAIQEVIEGKGFSVVRDFVGHGIGQNLHEDPEVTNFGPAHQGPVLKEGMVFAIEPMANLGGWQTRIKEDGWTVVTVDGKASAHFEHTVAITKEGPEILTSL